MLRSEKAQILGRQAAEFNLLNWANKRTICPYEGQYVCDYMQSYETSSYIIQKQYLDLPSIADAKKGEVGYFLTVPTKFIPSKVVCLNHL